MDDDTTRNEAFDEETAAENVGDDTDDTGDLDDAAEGSNPSDAGESDELDDAVVAADDTGMLAGERLITNAELLEGDPDLAPGGDV